MFHCCSVNRGHGVNVIFRVRTRCRTRGPIGPNAGAISSPYDFKHWRSLKLPMTSSFSPVVCYTHARLHPMSPRRGTRVLPFGHASAGLTTEVWHRCIRVNGPRVAPWQVATPPTAKARSCVLRITSLIAPAAQVVKWRRSSPRSHLTFAAPQFMSSRL